jgi:hypothetical protein
MTADEDPEARIRELERSLNDQAKASELGAGQSGGNSAYLPPPATGYSQPDYSTGQPYGTQPYTTPQYGTQQPYAAQQPYGTAQYGGLPYDSQVSTPRRRSSGGIPWRVFAIFAVVVVSIVLAIVKVSNLSSNTGSGTIHLPSVPSVSSMPSIPAAPNVPASPNAPAAPVAPGPDVITASPDTPANVSGIDDTKAVNCTEGTVSISGIRNHVNITGHCVSVSVSGIDNQVTVDATDAIDCFGTGNSVGYRTGAPQVNTSGSNNVFQGG